MWLYVAIRMLQAGSMEVEISFNRHQDSNTCELSCGSYRGFKMTAVFWRGWSLKVQCSIETSLSLKFCVGLRKSSSWDVGHDLEGVRVWKHIKSWSFEMVQMLQRRPRDCKWRIHAGRSSTSRNEDNVQHVCNLLKSDRRWLRARIITDQAGIEWLCTSEDLQMKKICTKFVTMHQVKLVSKSMTT